MLEPYHARLRDELERRGGTVEKFIGDAVMALFGAPTAHEDDPERAVRAALAIRDWIREEGELQVRIARHDRRGARRARRPAGRGRGHGLRRRREHRARGCSRPLRSTGSSSTRRRTARRRQAIVVRDARAGRGEGKAEPVPVWEALEARSRFGVDVARDGRRTSRRPRARARPPARHARERAAGAVAAARDARRRPRNRQEPARLRALRRRSSNEPSSSTGARAAACRTARASPSGRSSEMVKAQAGILETDSAEEAQEKLREVVAELSTAHRTPTGSSGHLRPLVGLAERGARQAATAGPRRSRPGGGSSRRWPSGARSSSSSRICTGPTTACSTSSTTSSTGRRGVPLLVVCTARPELLARRAAAGAAASRTRRRSRSRRSSDEETARLLHGAARASVLPGRRSGDAPRACRRQPPLRRGVRADGRRARRRRRASSGSRSPSRASSPRGSTRSPRGEAAPPGRRGHRQGLLARRAASGSAVGQLRGRAARSIASSARSSCAASAAPRSATRASTCSAISSCATSPTRRSRVRPRREASARRRMDRVAGPPGRPRRDARAPLPDRTRARQSGRRRDTGARGARSAEIVGGRGPGLRPQRLSCCHALLLGRPRPLAHGRPGASAASLAPRAESLLEQRAAVK